MIAAASTVVDAPIERVWALLDDFTAWHVWIPHIESTTMDRGMTQAPVGSTRILTREDGSTIREKLVRKDDEAHLISYTFDGAHPYPVRRYIGTVRLEPVTTSGATFVHWSGDFDSDASDEDEAAENFKRVFLIFFESLAGLAAEG